MFQENRLSKKFMKKGGSRKGVSRPSEEIVPSHSPENFRRVFL